MPFLGISEMFKYFENVGLTKLLIRTVNFSNNSKERYHAKLKAIIKTSHPRIWTFITILNEIIQDIDNDIGRLRQGREITHARKKKH